MTPSGIATSGWTNRSAPRIEPKGVRLSCRWLLGSGGTLLLRIDGRDGELVLDQGRSRPIHPIVGAKAASQRPVASRWKVDVVGDGGAGGGGIVLRLVPDRSDRVLTVGLDLVSRAAGAAPLVLTTIPEAIGLAGGTYALESIMTYE